MPGAFLDDPKFIVFMCWGQGTCAVQGTALAWVSSLLPLCGPWGQTQVIVLGSRHLYLMSHFASPKPEFNADYFSLPRNSRVWMKSPMKSWKISFFYIRVEKKRMFWVSGFFPHECFIFTCLSCRAEIMSFSWSPRSCDSERISSLWLRLLLTQPWFIILFRQWNFWEAVI